MEACEVGRCRVDLRWGGDVISGGSAGWLGFEEGEDTGDGELGGGDVVSSGGDIMVAIVDDASRVGSSIPQ